MKKFLLVLGLIVVIVTIVWVGCRSSNTKSKAETEKIMAEQKVPINITVFLDLSDRIEKKKDNIIQFEKDTAILNGLIDLFIKKQDKEGFQKSRDNFQVVFYPAPSGANEIAKSLSLDLAKIEGPKKKALLNFKKYHRDNIKSLYDNALQAKDYFGSDIWGYFEKDKVADVIKKGYRNIFIIFTDGYIYDENNVREENGYYSYILPKVIQSQKGLIPCKLSNADFELYLVECNPYKSDDSKRMRELLNSWFSEMGIKSIDIQETDLPNTTLNHLKSKIYD
ncbi:MAG: hypothetical protein HDS03_03870 [Bacteroides sp.]|nr:hypothetical protein [Bacteroides sp.]